MPSIAAVLKWEVFKVMAACKRAPSIAAVLNREALQTYGGGGRERLL